MANLTTKQRVFVEAYLETLNATEAARRAGYSEHTASVQGCKLLQHPPIRAVLDERLPGVLEDKSLKQSRMWGYVYVLRADNGLVKIGQTKRPKDRFRVFNTGLPYDLECVHLIEHDHYEQVEIYLHSIFDRNRVRGEWFHLSDEDIRNIPNMVQQWQPNPA